MNDIFEIDVLERIVKDLKENKCDDETLKEKRIRNLREAIHYLDSLLFLLVNE